MFICKNCHPNTKCSRCGGLDSHDFKDSFGNCEVCKQRTGCADCVHYHYCPVIRMVEVIPLRPDLA